MPSDRSRRRFLHGTGATLGCTAVSGCLFGIASGADAGTLVIRNDDSEEHTVTISVTKTSEDDDDIGRHDETPSSETEPIWEREERFTVGGDDEARHADFLTETGAFYLDARSETDARDDEWVGLYDAADGGVAEDAIFVDIDEDGRVNVRATHGD